MVYLLKRYEAVDWVQIRISTENEKLSIHFAMFKIWTPNMQKVRKVCPTSKAVTLFKAPTGVLRAIRTNYIFKRQLFRQPWDNCGTTLRQLWHCFGTVLHNSCHPTIRDGSTWSKIGARGEHGDVFLFSNLGALRFSENRAPILGEARLHFQACLHLLMFK